jgi:hypothetical protein
MGYIGRFLEFRIYFPLPLHHDNYAACPKCKRQVQNKTKILAVMQLSITNAEDNDTWLHRLCGRGGKLGQCTIAKKSNYSFVFLVSVL